MTPPPSPTSLRPTPYGPRLVAGLPPAVWQRVINHARPHDALALGCTARPFREMSAQHPVLKAPLAWADPALCVTPRVAARKLADLSEENRRAFLREPYFATRPDEHQLAYYGALYPFASVPSEELAVGDESSISARIERLVQMRQRVERRLDLARCDGEIKRRLLPRLSLEDRRSLLLSPPSVPFSSSTLARMGSLLVAAGAAPSTRVRFLAGLLEPLDDRLFEEENGIGEHGEGTCPISTLLRDVHREDPIEHVLDVLPQAHFEQDPLLVRRVWHRIAGEPYLMLRALRQGLDPTTPATEPDETLAGAMLQLEIEEEALQEEEIERGSAAWGHRFMPLPHLLSWHVLLMHGFYLDQPIPSRGEVLVTYGEMLEQMYPRLGSLLLEPLERPSSTLGGVTLALLHRLRRYEDAQLPPRLPSPRLPTRAQSDSCACVEGNE